MGERKGKLLRKYTSDKAFSYKPDKGKVKAGKLARKLARKAKAQSYVN
jgi:hypothetical protein